MDQEADRGQGQGDSRSGSGDEDLLPRSVRHSTHAGHAAKDGQLDTEDRHLEPPGQDRMPQLVEQHHGECGEEHRHRVQAAPDHQGEAHQEEEGELDMYREAEQAPQSNSTHISLGPPAPLNS